VKILNSQSARIAGTELRRLGLTRQEYHALLVARDVMRRKLREQEWEIERLTHQILNAVLRGELVPKP
jgi:hypothetical protein